MNTQKLQQRYRKRKAEEKREHNAIIKELAVGWVLMSKDERAGLGHLPGGRILSCWFNRLKPLGVLKQAMVMSDGQNWYMNDPFTASIFVTPLTGMTSSSQAKAAALQIWKCTAKPQY